MPKDYKHRAIKKQKKTGLGWVWAISGFVIGALSSSLFCHQASQPKSPPPDQFNPPPIQSTSEPKPEPPIEKKPAGLKLQFYDQLKSESNDPIINQAEQAKKKTQQKKPSEEIKPVTKINKPEKTAVQKPAQPQKSSSSEQYWVQISAFKEYREADKLKYQLVLKGFHAQVKAARIKNQTWYRVLLGPYTKDRSLSIIKKLKSEGYDAFIRR